MKAIIVGPDRGLTAELQALGVETTELELGTGESLREAGVASADLFVLTDVAEATAVPVARDLNPELRVVVYAPDSIPEFLRGQVDIALAPGVLSPSVVAEELVGPTD